VFDLDEILWVCVRVAVCDSVLQCVAVRCAALYRTIRQVHCTVLQHESAVFGPNEMLRCVRVLQCVAMCCSVLQ